MKTFGIIIFIQLIILLINWIIVNPKFNVKSESPHVKKILIILSIQMGLIFVEALILLILATIKLWMQN
jgi:hypothetical protein